MERDNDNDRTDTSGSNESNTASPPTLPSSKRLGDTQPFRPPQVYKPLSSEHTSEEQDHQQTAPYRPVQSVKGSIKAPTPRKSISLATVLGVLALLLMLAAAIAYFLIIKSGTEAGSGTLPAESVLPATTLGYISISPAPVQSQQQAFGQLLDTFEAQPGSKAAIASLVLEARHIISDTGLSLGSATDPATLETVAKYLGGNVTIALLAPSEGDLLSLKVPAGGHINQLAAFDVISQKVVGLVDLDFNPSGPQEGLIAQLRAVKDNLDKAKVVETYNGTDIRQYTGGPLPIYFSLLNGTSTAAVGIGSAPIKVLIDELRANKGLKEDARFKSLSGKVPAERVAALYLNLGETYELVETLQPDIQMQDQLRVSGSILATLSGGTDGLQFDIATPPGGVSLTGVLSYLLAPMFKLANLQANTSSHIDTSILKDVPADSLGFVAGSDPKDSVLATIDAINKSNPTAVTQLEKTLSDQTGLTLRDDILNAMSGDFVASLPPYDIKAVPDPPPPFTVQLKLTEKERAIIANSIKQGVSKLSGGKAEPFNAGGGTFYPTSPESLTATIIGVTPDRAMVAYGRDLKGAIAEVESVTANLGKGFGTTDKWKSASAHLPQNNNLVGYLDAATYREMSERAMTQGQKADYDKIYAPFLKPIKYIVAGSSTGPADALNLTRIFVGISK